MQGSGATVATALIRQIGRGGEILALDKAGREAETHLGLARGRLPMYKAAGGGGGGAMAASWEGGCGGRLIVGTAVLGGRASWER